MDAVLRLAAILHECYPRTGQVTQGSLLGRGNKAWRDQPVGQKLGDPICILAIRLLARAAMHIARVSHHHFRDTTDDVMDGFLIDARTFHADDWTLLLGQPGGKSLQIWNGCSEFLSRLMHMLPVNSS